MEINKKDLDKVIELSKKYFITYDHGETLDEYYEILSNLFGEDSTWAGNLIDALTIRDKQSSNKIYYKVLEAAGFDIVEE